MSLRQEHVTRFRALNEQGRLLLPNAWDCAAARLFEAAGFDAVATTSGGIAYSNGLQDAQRIGREAMLQAVARIVESVQMPVSADIEAGYGDAPAAVADTVRAFADVGVAGMNLEDRRHGVEGMPMHDVTVQAERLAAAREASAMWINARTDTFLLGLGHDDEERLAMTIERARAYLAAGADMVFVPCLSEASLVRRLTDAVPGPISLMALPDGPSAHEMFAAGAQRVSMGVWPMLACMGLIREMADEGRQHGTWQAMSRFGYGYPAAEKLFARAP